VAVWEKRGKALQLWYQQKTPLSPEHAVLYRQEHIEPDVRVRAGAINDTSDLAILELKDRYKARGSEEKRIARMYATTGARLVCIANYSEFGSKSLRAQVYRETERETEILLVDEFMPGMVPQEVADQFTLSIGRFMGNCDLLGDVSSSMVRGSVRRAIQTLTGMDISLCRMFSFDTDLQEVSNGAQADWQPGEGGTDLLVALRKYLTLNTRCASGKVIILTDDDGVHQCQDAKKLDEFKDLNLFCSDARSEFDSIALSAWLVS
jgi:hypothetical protein